jgi:hypothetical protein
MQEINIFEDQLHTRKTADEIMFEGAFDDLVSILYKNAGMKDADISDAVHEILVSLGLKIPDDVPENVTDAEARIEYMLRPSGCMRRRVELKGEWWKDSSDPFFGCTADGEPVALLPGKTGGYAYRGKDGKKYRRGRVLLLQTLRA